MCSYKSVKEWSKIAGLTVNEEFTMNVSEKDRKLAVDLIQEELDELQEAIRTNNAVEVIDALNDLQWVIDRAKQTFGVDESSFEVLVRSNYSKFCTTEKVANDTKELYAKGKHPNKPLQKIDVDIQKVGSLWTLKNKNGKLMKNRYFVDCDYKNYIKNGDTKQG